jgi:limonene-1,2-epoxide hydrolase
MPPCTFGIAKEVTLFEQRDATTRRSFLTIAGAGLAGIVESASVAAAAEPTPAERVNMKLVTSFCEAFSADDVDRIMSFMADPCSYRVTEAMEPIKGVAAVRNRITDLVKVADRFEVLDTFARGPMVFNERIDHFAQGFFMRSWHGVGVFFVKDGKIVEWQDFTISIERP